MSVMHDIDGCDVNDPEHVAAVEADLRFETDELDPDQECTYHGCDHGLVWGSDRGSDPLWYDPDRLYPCPSCGGTGKAADMTAW